MFLRRSALTLFAMSAWAQMAALARMQSPVRMALAPRTPRIWGRARSRYMPHRGGGRRPLARPFTPGDLARIEAAETKRAQRYAF